ncbi:MAG: RHS repeat-associated core domain-containing protein [Nostoc sp.]|uniref:RHS repeat protein n=1 Tax=Nostoc sp. TaxID=1180 RepID=UPI002FF17A2E
MCFSQDYNSDLGRFISKDAFAGHLASPISENPYVYANANPVNFTDPSGYESLGELSAAEAIIGILSSIEAVVGRTVAATVGGALASGVFNAARQGVELIDGSRTDFSFDEVIKSAEIGAVLAPLFVVLPEAAIYFAYEGIKSGIKEIKAGNLATGAFDIISSIAPLISKGNQTKAGNQPEPSETVNYLFGGEENQPSFSHSITAEESSTLSQIRNVIIAVFT